MERWDSSKQVGNHNFIYINNDRIGKDNLWNDRIHLNKSGTIILYILIITGLVKTIYGTMGFI